MNAAARVLSHLYRAALDAVDPRRSVAAALRGPAGPGRSAEPAGSAFSAIARLRPWMFDAVLPTGAEGSRRSAPRLSGAHRSAREGPLFRSPGAGRLDRLPPALGPSVLFRVSASATSSSAAFRRRLPPLLCLPRPVSLSRRRAGGRAASSERARRSASQPMRTSLSAVRAEARADHGPRVVTLVPLRSPGIGRRSSARGRPSGSARRTFDRVVGSNGSWLAGAAVGPAAGLGRAGRGDGSREARVAGRLAARLLRCPPGEVVLAGGETTVSLGRRAGTGGRNLEVALSAAVALEGEPGVALLAAGSDGKDGTSNAAGARVDGHTISTARRLGADPAAALSRHDTEPFFGRVGGLFRTGPTGTNVGDWAFGVRVLRR